MSLRYRSEISLRHPRYQAGWRDRGPDTVLAHPTFGTIVHVVVCDDHERPIYDLPGWADPPSGAVIVPQAPDGRLVFVDQWRPVAGRPGAPGAHPPRDLGAQGVRSLELPRGFPRPGESAEEVALREAEEETGLRVRSVRPIGWCNPNTTFCLHPIAVFAAMLSDEPVSTPPDPGEAIVERPRLTLDEALAAVREGRIFCGFTQSALLAWVAQTR